MTKGQIEFVIGTVIIVIGLSAAGVIGYNTYYATSKNVVSIDPPKVIPVVKPTATPTPTPTHTSVSQAVTPVVTKCEVLNDIHVRMVKAQVAELCGTPDEVDESSAQVKVVEKTFRHDEIWYYIKQNAAVELTNDVVTSVHMAGPATLVKPK